MSVGGGFKKGKAEFAMKDIDGNDIKTATESFKYVTYEGAEHKVLGIDGIDIMEKGISQYGIYFRYGGTEGHIYSDDLLYIDCNTGVQIDSETGININGLVYLNNSNISLNNSSLDFQSAGAKIIDTSGEWDSSAFGQDAYLSVNDAGEIAWATVNQIHCWQFRKSPATLFIYLADYTGDDENNNLYTYFVNAGSSQFDDRVNKLVNISGSFSAPYSGYKLLSYTVNRTGTSPNVIVQFVLTIIGKDSSNAIDIRELTLEMTSNSYHNADIVYKF